MSFKKLFTVCVLGLTTLCVGMQTNAYAKYPTKTIKLLVMANPGGGTDIFARRLAPLLAKELGQNIIVSNQPGGGGNLAANTLVRGKHDGYTLAILGEDVSGLNFVFLNVAYEYEDLLPISFIGGNSFGLYANGESKWNNFDDVVKTAKEENRAIKVAVFDTQSRLALASLAKNAGIEFIMVPSQSAPTVLTAVLGKHVELSSIGTGMSDSIVAGKAKLIGSLSTKRFPKAPDVPTVLEQGYDFEPHTSMTFLYAPSGIPEEAQVKLEAAIIKIGATEEYKKILDDLSFFAPEEYGIKPAQEVTKKAYDFAMEIKAAKTK